MNVTVNCRWSLNDIEHSISSTDRNPNKKCWRKIVGWKPWFLQVNSTGPVTTRWFNAADVQSKMYTRWRPRVMRKFTKYPSSFQFPSIRYAYNTQWCIVLRLTAKIKISGIRKFFSFESAIERQLQMWAPWINLKKEYGQNGTSTPGLRYWYLAKIERSFVHTITMWGR